MPEELDPTTARLISELSASMLPVLTKSLSSAIPSNDFTGAVERLNRTAQELKTGIDRSVRSGIDDSRAGRSMIIQSVGTVLEEISGLRGMLERLPEMLSSAVSRIKPEEKKNDFVPEALMNELEGISERIDSLTQGIKVFFETYAESRENDSAEGKSEIIRPVFDSDVLSGLEGLVRAEGKSHSKELAEFSREISAMTEENNAAMIHEVREAVAEELLSLIHI